MAFKTKRDLLDWLEQGDCCGSALIGRDWDTIQQIVEVFGE